jgi:hypothetical protein
VGFLWRGKSWKKGLIGFDVQEHLLNAVAKLIFVLTIALYWAVSTGFLSSNEDSSSCSMPLFQPYKSPNYGNLKMTSGGELYISALLDFVHKIAEY